MQRKRSKSFSLSEGLLRKLNRMWYEEVRRRLHRDERLSFSRFVEDLLWQAVKTRPENSQYDKRDES
ncbi:hypothetical protein CW712_05160 [Candidatus Bathyarchaeota archaeon]|nr:MAG: hypothetical protein CW712_05160 [Candidatus Bathyarchaeota archaeon]